jgi:hypothetical protein
MGNDCRRCANLSQYTNCAAILRGEMVDKHGQPYMPGALTGPPTPTAWADKCGHFRDQGYTQTNPHWRQAWQ